MTEKEKLIVFRICLEANIITLSQIQKWAEKTLVNNEIIRDDYILDLCSSESKGINEIVHVLKQNEGSVENPEIWKIVYGVTWVLYEKNIINLKRACNFVYKVATEISYATENDLSEGISLDDSFYLASKNICGNLNDVEKELKNITSGFKYLGLNFIESNFNNEDVFK